jgi:tRNA-modifying protein YgfZ
MLPYQAQMSDSAALGLIKHKGQGWLRVTGPDRMSWLQGITTADVLRVEQGAFWGLFLDRKGKIRHEVIGIADSSAIRLFSLGQGVDSLYQYLDSLLVMEDVALDVEVEGSFWSVHGAAAEAQLNQSNAVATGKLSWLTQADRVYAVRDIDEPDWLQTMKQFGLEPAPPNAWELLRIAAGVPQWGLDYSEQDTPHHAGLFGRAVSPNKGCYVGQEVVCKVEMRGSVSQRVVRLTLDSAEGVAAGTIVMHKGSRESVGSITSVAWDPEGRAAYAMARIKSSAVEPGTELLVGTTLGRLSDELLARSN